MSYTAKNESTDSLSILLKKTSAVITVNKESLDFICSRKGQNVILKYQYTLEMRESIFVPPDPKVTFIQVNQHHKTNSPSYARNIKLQKHTQTRPVNDIIESWTYKGESMTREAIAFSGFVDLRVKKFSDLLRLQENYTALYESYSQVLIDVPKSRAAALCLLKNVERMQVAIGQIHEQIIDVKDDTEGKEEEVNDCITKISEGLNKLNTNIPSMELSLEKSAFSASNTRIQTKDNKRSRSKITTYPATSFTFHTKPFLAGYQGTFSKGAGFQTKSHNAFFP